MAFILGFIAGFYIPVSYIFYRLWIQGNEKEKLWAIATGLFWPVTLAFYLFWVFTKNKG